MGKPSASDGQVPVPRTVRAIEQLLAEMGVASYEPRVVHQLLEFAHKRLTDVLRDAQLYSAHAGRPTVNPDDVELAIESRSMTDFAPTLSTELLLAISETVNKQPLPDIHDRYGVRLPPDRYAQTAQNYQMDVTSLGKAALERALRAQASKDTMSSREMQDVQAAAAAALQDVPSDKRQKMDIDDDYD